MWTKSKPDVEDAAVRMSVVTSSKGTFCLFLCITVREKPSEKHIFLLGFEVPTHLWNVSLSCSLAGPIDVSGCSIPSVVVNICTPSFRLLDLFVCCMFKCRTSKVRNEEKKNTTVRVSPPFSIVHCALNMLVHLPIGHPLFGPHACEGHVLSGRLTSSSSFFAF